MWMAVLKPYIDGKYSKKQPTENQKKKVKTEYKLSGGPLFTFSLPRGAILPSVPPGVSKLHEWNEGGTMIPGTSINQSLRLQPNLSIKHHFLTIM